MRTCLKKFAMVLVCAAAMACMCIFNGNALFGGYADVTLGSQDGDVTQPSQDADGTYLIGTAEELAWFASYVNAGNGSINGRLTADIVLNDCDVNAAVEAGSTDGLVQWTPIGNNSNKFNGKFDGAGHTVSGIYINTTSNYQGLFGYTDSGSSIANVGVVNSYIKGGAYAGGICGRNNGSISNSYNTGEVSSNGSSAYAGGICGYNIGGSIENSCNTGAVSSSSSCAAFAGGICGYNADNGDNYKGSIANSCNTGEVSSSSSANGYSAYAGGICGDNYKGSIANSCNTGAVSSSSNGSSAYAGGICGWNSSGSIENSYNTGEVSSSSAYFVAYAGGICGENRNGGSIENSYNTGAFSSSNGSSVYAGGICGWNYGSNSSISNCMYLPQSGISGIGIDSGTTTNVTEFSSDDNKAKIEEALNAWVNSEDNNPGGTYESWAIVPNYNDGYPVLVPQTETVTKSDGTTAEYYLLYNPADMYWFANKVNTGNGQINAKLGINIILNDCDVNEVVESGNTDGLVQWTPIGNDSNNFCETFDGAGHTVSGIYINSSKNYQGLFGYTASGSSIANVGVVNSYIKGGSCAGGICGYNRGSITNSYNTGAVTSPSSFFYSEAYAGGICGRNEGSIANSYNTGEVSSSSSNMANAGGICGYNRSGSIANSYNTGAVTSSSSSNAYAGGICGYNRDGSITNSYNTGAVTSSSDTTTSYSGAYAGGICGYYSGRIKNSYNTGAVTSSSSGKAYAGGICGHNSGSIINSFSLGDLPCVGGGNSAGTAKITTTEKLLYDLNTWLDANNAEHKYCYWISDTENVNGGYPLLSGRFDTFTVTWMSEGQQIASETYMYGAMPTHADPVKEASGQYTYTFTGWQPEIVRVTKDAEYTAQFKEEANIQMDEDGTYLIGTVEELRWFAEHVNAGNSGENTKARLTADIVLNDRDVIAAVEAGNTDGLVQWTPIGNNSNNFRGTFDGNGHIVSGIYINSTSDYQGLFGHIRGAYISNIGVLNSYIKGNQYVGGICGYANAVYGEYDDIEAISYITNSFNAGVVIGNREIGGICGYSYGSITNCYNIGEVDGERNVGGISGSINGIYEYAGAGVSDSYSIGVENSASNGITKITSPDKLLYDLNTWLDTNDAEHKYCYWISDLENKNGGYPLLGDQKMAFKITYIVDGKTIERSYVLRDMPNYKAVGYANENNLYKFKGWDKPFEPVTGAATYTAEYETVSAPESIPAEDFEDNVTYLIDTPDKLKWAALYVNEVNPDIDIKLTGDILINDGTVYDENGELKQNLEKWTPIGTKDNPFKGNFNGEGYTVSGIYIETTDDYQGLFGCVGDWAYVYNVGLVNSYIKGGDYVGGICGHNYGRSVDNCYNAATVIGNNRVGGICGNSGPIRNCYNIGNVSGNEWVGGICGYGGLVSIENAYNMGIVNGKNKVGGICGENYSGGIENSYNATAVNGADNIGGICGYIDNYGGISGSYNSGEVTGDRAVGAILGYLGNSGGGISNCQYLSGTAADAVGVNEKETQNAIEFTSDNAPALLKESPIDKQELQNALNSWVDGEISLNSTDLRYWMQDENGINDGYPVFGNEQFTITWVLHNETITEQYKYGYMPSFEATNYIGSDNAVYIFSGWDKELVIATKEVTYTAKYDIIEEPDIDTDGTTCLIGTADELRWFAEQINSGNNAISGKLIDNIDLNPKYTFEFDEVSGLVRVSFNGEDVCALGMGIKGTEYNTETAGVIGEIYSTDALTGNGLITGTLPSDIVSWTPIGQYIPAPEPPKDAPPDYAEDFDSYIKAFKGTFDGAGHTVSGIYINSEDDAEQGLFGYAKNGSISNVGVVNSYIKGGYSYVGGICGFADTTQINNSYNAGLITGESDVGGICGGLSEYGGSVNNSYNTGLISGRSNIGGIVGLSNGDTVNSYNTGMVIGRSDWDCTVGGICGNNGYENIINCYNTGIVSGYSEYSICNVGGVCGKNNGSGSVVDNYNMGEINGGTSNSECNVGSICGLNCASIEKNMYLEQSGIESVGKSESYGIGGTVTDTIPFSANTTPHLLNDGSINKEELKDVLNSWVDSNNEDGNYSSWTSDTENVNDGYPVFDMSAFTVTWQLEDGTVLETESYGYKRIPSYKGEIPTKEADEKYTYTFAGWTPEITEVTEDIIYTAVFESELKMQPDENGIYLIHNAEELRWFAKYVNDGKSDENMKAKLAADIDLNPGYTFEFDEASGLVRVSFNGQDVCALGMGITGKTYHKDTAGISGKIYSADALKSNDLVEDTLPDGIVSWTPIGKTKDRDEFHENDEDYSKMFKGTFDGDNHTVSGIYINLDDHSDISCGLFGCIRGASVSNVGVVNSYIGGFCSIGGIVAVPYDEGTGGSIINNCYNTGAITATGYMAGGICGATEPDEEGKTRIINCYNTGTITGDMVGGICGAHLSGEIINCYNTGLIASGYEGGNGVIGGISGYIQGYAKISNSYNAGTIVMNAGCIGVGGISGGISMGNAAGNIVCCVNTGNVISNGDYVGGICGFISSSGGISDSINTGSVTGNDYVGGIHGMVDGEDNDDFAVNITNNCNAGSITGNDRVGGICGNNVDGMNISGCILLTGTADKAVGEGDASGITEVSIDQMPSIIARDGSINKRELKSELNKWVSDNNSGSVYYYWASDADNINDGYPILSKYKVAYKIEWVNNGEQLETELYAYGEIPSYKGEEPTKAADENYTYTFTGWQPEIVRVTKDTEYTAQFKKEVNIQIENGVYLIHNAEELRWFAEQVNSGNNTISGRLTDNIDLNPGYTFEFDEASGLVKVADTAGNVQCALGMGIKGKTFHTGTAGTIGAVYSAAALTSNGLTSGTLPSEIVSWTPIGNESTKFRGTFDGAEHTVSGIYINSEEDYQGLFGYTGSDSSISNVNVTNSYIKGKKYVGGICGWNNGSISNSYNTGAVSSSSSSSSFYTYVGGICGTNRGSISNSYNTGAVSSSSSYSAYAGGICGTNRGSISNSYNTGAVSSSSSSYSAYAGGICGYNYGSISNSYNTGEVSSYSSSYYYSAYAGGICGYNDEGSISNSYNTGEVSSSSNYYAYAGGICGENYGGSISNSYNTGAVSSSAYAGGICGWNNDGTISNCKFLTGTADKAVGKGDASGITEVSIDEMPSIIARDGSVNKEELKSELNEWVSDNNSGSVYHYWASDADNINDGYPILSKYKVAYKIEWVNNGEQLETELYVYGEMPSYKGEEPTKAADENYTYTFAGWEPEIATVKNDVTYEAKFDKKAKVQTDGNGAYLISKPEEFNWFIDEVNSGEGDVNIKLTGDIDLSSMDIPEIEGASALITTSFKGTFDGDGNSVILNGIPLFAELGTEAEVTNTSFEGTLDGNGCEYLGAIANVNKGTIINCRVDAALENAKCIGGLAGLNEGKIINCLSNATIKNRVAYDEISGGICADNKGSVQICVFSGSFVDISSAKFASIAYGNSGTISDSYYIITDAESINRPTAVGDRSKNSGASCYTEKDGVKLTTGMVMSKRISVLINDAVHRNGLKNLLMWIENTKVGTGIPAELSIFESKITQNVDNIESTVNDNEHKNEGIGTSKTDYAKEEYACLTYAAHIEDYGWLDFVNEGETAGTVDRSLRLEGIKINLDSNIGGSIEYRTHVQDYDWQDFVSNGAVSGTEGAALRAEAIEIRLTGELAEKYSVKYRVHVQDEGWQGWKYDGEMAGTTGLSARMEAIQIQLVDKLDRDVSYDDNHDIGYDDYDDSNSCNDNLKQDYASVSYAAHIQDYGWLDFVNEGETAGTVGEALRLEAVKIAIDSNLEGSIEYRTHVQDYDWQDFVSNGAVSGTEGAALRAEAIEIRLTGELAEKYSVKYRVHVQDEGWQGWKYDGEMAGTTGLSARMEAIQIQLVGKLDRDVSYDDDYDDSNSCNDNLKQDYASVSYAAHIEDYGWLDFVDDGQTAGTTNQSLRLEGLKIVVDSNLEGSIEYRTHVQDLDWQDFVRDGEVSGTEGQALRAEAVEIRLTGELAEKYSVKYRAHVQDEGWQDWKYDGEMAGTTGQSLRLEAIEIILVEK